MLEYEIPSEEVYKGEDCCPFKCYDVEPFWDDFWAQQQWYFEKAYAESPNNPGFPFRDLFFKGPEFEQYQFFKGEKECPSNLGFEGSTWWQHEQNHWVHGGNYPYVYPYVIYFRNWIKEKAAPNSGHNLEIDGNPWLDRYLFDVPKKRDSDYEKSAI